MYDHEETELPKSLSYLGSYPKYIQTKYWHDINFKLWNTTLSRVQVTCYVNLENNYHHVVHIVVVLCGYYIILYL